MVRSRWSRPQPEMWLTHCLRAVPRRLTSVKVLLAVLPLACLAYMPRRTWALLVALLLVMGCGPGMAPLPPRPAPFVSPTATASPFATISISGPLPGEAQALNGAGGTFPAPLYQKWFDEYAR